MRFISIPVGIDSTRNHRKHDNEIIFTTESLRPAKSLLT